MTPRQPEYEIAIVQFKVSLNKEHTLTLVQFQWFLQFGSPWGMRHFQETQRQPLCHCFADRTSNPEKSKHTIPPFYNFYFSSVGGFWTRVPAFPAVLLTSDDLSVLFLKLILRQFQKWRELHYFCSFWWPSSAAVMLRRIPLCWSPLPHRSRLWHFPWRSQPFPRQRAHPSLSSSEEPSQEPSTRKSQAAITTPSHRSSPRSTSIPPDLPSLFRNSKSRLYY